MRQQRPSGRLPLTFNNLMKLNFKTYMAFALCTLSVLSANAYDVEDNGIYYTLNSKTGTATVTWLVHYNPSNEEAYKGNVVVPESITVDGVDYPVTAVASRAFYSCAQLESISLPNTITTIGQSAFQGCLTLKEVHLPPNVTALETSTFHGCASLQGIQLPASLLSIGTSAFAGCTALESIELPDACGFIDTSAFGGCSMLKDVTLPRNLLSVGYRVFNSCNSLETIKLPNYLATLNISMFENCINLKNVYFGEGVTQVEPLAFSGCTSLRDLYFSSDTPPGCGNANSFKGAPMINLHVPVTAIERFHSKNTWKNFENILPLQCATPVIACNAGQLTFFTSTNLQYANVSERFVYSIDVSDLCSDAVIGEGEEAFCDLSLTYDVRVKSMVDGALDSPEVVAQLCWIDAENTFNADAGEIVTAIDTPMEQRPILVTSSSGALTVTGLSDGERVMLYDLSGRQLGCQTVVGSSANLDATAGQVVIVRVGNSSFKVRVN